MHHRLLDLAAVSAVVVAFAGSTAAADPDGCCDVSAGATVIYAAPPVTIVVPPTGYVLDPSDARKPIYVVNQGPVYSGPGIYTYAYPTYSEGGYADANPYPYVRTYGGWYDAPVMNPHRWRHHDVYRGRRWHHWSGYRPYGGPPSHAYRYQPAPSARVIDVRSKGH